MFSGIISFPALLQAPTWLCASSFVFPRSLPRERDVSEPRPSLLSSKINSQDSSAPAGSAVENAGLGVTAALVNTLLFFSGLRNSDFSLVFSHFLTCTHTHHNNNLSNFATLPVNVYPLNLTEILTHGQKNKQYHV